MVIDLSNDEDKEYSVGVPGQLSNTSCRERLGDVRSGQWPVEHQI